MCFNTIYRRELSTIHKMSNPLARPQFLDPSSINTSARESIAGDFLCEIGVGPPDPSDPPHQLTVTLELIKEALEDSGFPLDDITHVLKEFQTGTMSSLITSRTGNESARMFGFPDLHTIKLLQNEPTHNTPKGRAYVIPLSTEYLLSLLKTNPGLTAEPCAFLTQQSLDYLRINNNISRPTNPMTPTERRLSQIRRNTTRNGNHLYTSKPKTKSLSTHALNPTAQTRLVPRKDTNAIFRAANKDTSNSPVAYNCYR